MDVSYLVIPAKALLELQYESLGQQLPSLRELGVDDGHQCGVDVGEGRGGRLGLDHGTDKETTVRGRERRHEGGKGEGREVSKEKRWRGREEGSL